MTRVLRYPRMTAAACLAVMICAVARDACIGAGLSGWGYVLLIATVVLLALCLGLLSCRFFVDEIGVGVGFLLRVRRSTWEDIASFGLCAAIAAAAISMACMTGRRILSI